MKYTTHCTILTFAFTLTLLTLGLLATVVAAIFIPLEQSLHLWDIMKNEVTHFKVNGLTV